MAKLRQDRLNLFEKTMLGLVGITMSSWTVLTVIPLPSRAIGQFIHDSSFFFIMGLLLELSTFAIYENVHRRFEERE